MTRPIAFCLGGTDYEAPRFRLGQYLDFQILVRRLSDAVGNDDNGAIADALFRIIRIAVPALARGVYDKAPWYEVVQAYIEIQLATRLDIDFAILKYPPRGKNESVAWDYPERVRYVWHHILAGRYGWSMEYIDQLQPEDAMALVQEIIADQYGDREFEYSLSEVAYEFSAATKKSRYRPMPKPPWMTLRKPEDIITKIPRAMLPCGVIVKARGKKDEAGQS